MVTRKLCGYARDSAGWMPIRREYGEKLTSGGQFQFSRAEPHSSGSVLIFEVGYRGHPNGVSVFLL
jgi:hypothetical protein